MSGDERTELEERLTRSLQAVARLVPDSAPPRHAPVHEPRTLQPFERRRAVTDPERSPAPPTVVGTASPRTGRRRRVLAAAVVATCAAGAVAFVLSSVDPRSSRVQIGAGGAHASTTPTTEAAPLGTVVPDVVGKTQTEAMKTLADAGFIVTVENPSGAMSSRVVAQNPSSGRLPPGSAVAITVAG